MNPRGSIYTAAVCLAGIALSASTLSHWRSDDLYRFCFYLALSGLAAGLKADVPGIRGTMSICVLFV